MDWDKIKDPEDEFIFSEHAWDGVKSDFDASEIQQKIQENGVQGMVRDVNNWYRAAKLTPPLLLSWRDGKRAVMSRYEK